MLISVALGYNRESAVYAADYAARFNALYPSLSPTLYILTLDTPALYVVPSTFLPRFQCLPVTKRDYNAFERARETQLSGNF